MIPKIVSDDYEGKNVLITGGTGLIGRQVVDILCGFGATVRIASVDRLTVDARAEHLFADLTDIQVCREVTSGVDVVLHLAGIKGSVQVTQTRPASFFVPRLMMNTNLLEAAREKGVQRLVYTSSIGAYGAADNFREEEYANTDPPMDAFPGWAKRMAELQIDAYRIQYGLQHYAVVRPANVYGPGDNFDPETAMVIPSLMSRIAAGEDPLIVWGDGTAVRDFVYSRDVACGIVLASYFGTGSGFVNLGSGTGCSIKKLVETLQTFTNFAFEFDQDKPSGHPRRVMDISLAKRLLGYEPQTTLEEGLRATWNWYLGNREQHKQKVNYLQ